MGTLRVSSAAAWAVMCEVAIFVVNIRRRGEIRGRRESAGEIGLCRRGLVLVADSPMSPGSIGVAGSLRGGYPPVLRVSYAVENLFTSILRGR